MNLGRGDWGEAVATPGQVWATWFPSGGAPRSFIQGFGIDALDLSGRRAVPFHYHIGGNGLEQRRCWGNLQVDGHRISWNLEVKSTFSVTLSDKGWIGFSRSPHSDAKFSGEIGFECQCGPRYGLHNPKSCQ